MTSTKEGSFYSSRLCTRGWFDRPYPCHNICTFMLSTLLPKAITNKLDSLNWRFLWGGTDDKKGVHLVTPEWFKSQLKDLHRADTRFIYSTKPCRTRLIIRLKTYSIWSRSPLKASLENPMNIYSLPLFFEGFLCAKRRRGRSGSPIGEEGRSRI